MVFWEKYSLINHIKATFNTNDFTDLQFIRDILPSPTGIDAEIVNTHDICIITQIREFLKAHFRYSQKAPILDIPEQTLNDGLLLVVMDKTNIIAGCIRYHYIGTFKEKKIYCNDCFCIHPKWRKKGVGDYLLTALHQIVNKKTQYYSLFLKEGKRLSIFYQPFYSSIYVYKPVVKGPINNISSLTTQQAYKVLDILTVFIKDAFIIKNIDSLNQDWKLYKSGTDIVLACIQNTYQYFMEDNIPKHIGWITCWIESPSISDEHRTAAINGITASTYGKYDYMWANKEWLGAATDWKVDGPFHWYLYQWATNINIKKSYCILI